MAVGLRARLAAMALAALLFACAASPAWAIRAHPRGLLSRNAALESSFRSSLGSTPLSSDDFLEPVDAQSGGMPDFSIVEPANLALEASAHLPGGYHEESGADPASLDAGTYAILKLNCARHHAPEPCAPLSRATVTSAYLHVTQTDFWFVNLTLGDGHVLHATVAVDEVNVAPDLDCPGLAEGRFAPFNLVEIAAFDAADPGAKPRRVADVCAFADGTHDHRERQSAAHIGEPIDDRSFPWSDDDVLGEKALRVDGVDARRRASASSESDPGASLTPDLGDFDAALDDAEARLGAGGPYDCPLESPAPSDYSPPASYDLRDHYSHCEADKPGNQGQCGSCWAYAYAYMFSYRACIKSGGKYNELISTEQLVACEWGGSCGGGWDSRAAAAMHENWDEPTAMPSFGEHPYTHSRGSSSAASCMSRDLEDIRSGAVRAYAVDMPTIATANYRDDRYYFGNCKRYSSASSKEEHERWIQYQIQTGGPVTSVMTAKAFPRTGDAKSVHKCGGCGQIDHLVILVGWGVTDDGEKYWIMQNSWSDRWKDNGRVKIHRGDNECCIEQRTLKAEAHFDVMFNPDGTSAPKCSNGGVIDPETGLCKCPAPWTGPGVPGKDGVPGESGCEKCALGGCANGGTYDESKCTCACLPGFGGPRCATSIAASVSKGVLSATLRLGEMTEVDSDVALAVHLKKGNAAALGSDSGGVGTNTDASGWKVITKRGQLCGQTTATGGASACPDVDRSRELTAEIDLGDAGVVGEPGDELFVKFVQNLGLNEFGRERGHDMDKYGPNIAVSAGYFEPPKCGPSTLEVTLPAGEIADLEVSVLRGTIAMATVSLASADGAGGDVTKTADLCLEYGGEYGVRVKGAVAPGSKLARFDARVRTTEYDGVAMVETGSAFAFPSGLIFETPVTANGATRGVDGVAKFTMWDEPGSCDVVGGVPLFAAVQASAHGNGARASMMRWDVVDSATGSAVAHRVGGSFAPGVLRRDHLCVKPGAYDFRAGVTAHATGAGGWGFGSSWSIQRPGRDHHHGALASKSVKAYGWFVSGEFASEPFRVSIDEGEAAPAAGSPPPPASSDGDYDYDYGGASSYAASSRRRRGLLGAEESAKDSKIGVLGLRENPALHAAAALGVFAVFAAVAAAAERPRGARSTGDDGETSGEATSAPLSRASSTRGKYGAAPVVDGDAKTTRASRAFFSGSPISSATSLRRVAAASAAGAVALGVVALVGGGAETTTAAAATTTAPDAAGSLGSHYPSNHTTREYVAPGPRAAPPYVAPGPRAAPP